jgi:hypothetical protein
MLNDQWRICFRWVEKDAEDVEIVESLAHAKIRKAPIMGQIRNPHPGEILKEEFTPGVELIEENGLQIGTVNVSLTFRPIARCSANLR